MASCLRCRAGNEWIEGDVHIVDAPALHELCKIFEWSGGTIHQALDEVRRLRTNADALALLRELNDALVIPERFQPRVDAVLDRADTGPDFNQERNAHADTIASEHDSKTENEPQMAAANSTAAVCSAINRYLRSQMAKRRKPKLLSALIPDSWLDPLLTGDKAVLKGNGPWGCADIQRLLIAVKDRVQQAETKTSAAGRKE